MADVTLSKLRQLNQQVIIFYQNGGGHHLWPTESIFSCWPDTMRVCKVLIRDAQEEWKSKLLEKRKKANPEEVFGVYQTVLTPTRWTCAKFWGSVQTKCAEAINPRLGEWMRAGQAAMIYIADFVDQPGDFVESVLSLNRSAIGGRDFATAAEPGSLQQLTREPNHEIRTF
nr:hypothetical protein BaRGS_007938 [Batillaria attramentaria]